jgi:hypothetical protein
MNLVDDPDESIECPPAACRGCGADLASAPVTAQRRHQVTDIAQAPAPKVIEYVAQAKECAGCRVVQVKLPAAGVSWMTPGTDPAAASAVVMMSGSTPSARRCTTSLVTSYPTWQMKAG